MSDSTPSPRQQSTIEADLARLAVLYRRLWLWRCAWLCAGVAAVAVLATWWWLA